jgi:hypothetical protein
MGIRTVAHVGRRGDSGGTLSLPGSPKTRLTSAGSTIRAARPGSKSTAPRRVLAAPIPGNGSTRCGHERREVLITLLAASTTGAKGTGDLAGLVRVSCSLGGGCQRAIIWYANGGSRELGTLGGDDSWARDINAAGEVVGVSTSPKATRATSGLSQPECSSFRSRLAAARPVTL